MTLRIRRSVLFVVSFLAMASMSIPSAHAQQTLGGITGTVTDTSGAVVVGATVTLVGDQTKLSRTQTTSATGTYLFVNLPIGNYSLSFTQPGFQAQNVPSIQVQANRTATVNAELKVGNVSEAITVEETPLLNEVDTTNGYVMDKLEIDSIPLPTGSFTGLALLAPGVNAELPGGTGANAGLGNAPVWANGQRDTSNSYLLNGVDARNLFNGKSTSQVESARVVNNTGVSGASSLSAIPIQSSASVYLAIGESIPSPAPESIQEVRVNTSMYDAQQGSTSGAHIDMSTGTGTNNIHGTAYVHRGTNWLNADPFFYNADPNIPSNEKNPGLHRYTAGGAIGLPIKKDKLFFYGSYQHTRASDDEIGISRAFVPPDLTNDRSLGGLATAANKDTTFASPLNTSFSGPVTVTSNYSSTPCGSGASDTCGINPIAYTLFNYKFASGPLAGQYLIPSANPNSVIVSSIHANAVGANSALITAFPEDAEVPGTALFLANQAVGDLDWNPNSSHSFSAKYYYQHDPTTAPYAYSTVAGFTQHLDAGSQVISLSHTQIVKSNLSVTETFGFIREKAYSTIDQPFTPAQFASTCQSLTGATLADCTINTFGSPYFPGTSLVFAGTTATPYVYSMNIGAGAASQGAFTGVFQNRFNPSANAIWTKGKHTITFGGSYAYTQLNTRDRRNELGMIASPDFTNFMTGNLAPNNIYNITSLLVGNPNRYWRAKETGDYIQDKFQWKSNVAITAGLRFDWDGGLTEKNGNLLNFDPSKYSYDPATDTLASNGLIVAGNNQKAGTPGVSNSTLTGRQWGFAPRIGVAWSPNMFKSKIVVRAGWGMYYDRGELFAYLSPGLTQNITGGGPFGINQQQPFVNTQNCAIPADNCTATLENPWGTSLVQPPGNASGVVMPNACTLANNNNPSPVCPVGSQNTLNPTPFYLGAYARNNKLPYTMNSTLDIQWQPRNDLAIDIGYVNALGRHEIIPIPFNQSRIASPTAPLCGPAKVCANPGGSPFAQSYTYGMTVQTQGCNIFGNFCPANLPNGQVMQANPEGGNVDLRVPYIGYAAESELYTAEGISAYNALQAHVEKRLSHGLQLGVSYTFSRSFDEQSALGLFYNGNNPLNIRDGYGPSDFDRTHVFNVDYHYELPKFLPVNTFGGKIADGWAIQGVVTIQSGQPYSVIDYSGAVGSVYYSIFDGITNPIDPLAPGCTPKSALTGAIGNNPNSPALKANCFALPLLNPGDLNGAIPGASSNNTFGDTFETNFTTGQRNIFRQSWQKRADLSLLKVTKVTERVAVKYSFDVYNLTNTPSFDIPIDNVTQNLAFSAYPVAGLCPSPTISVPNCTNADNFGSPFFNSPGGLGQVTKTIGSSRQIQMSLSLSF
jgi:hypothetical protein